MQGRTAALSLFASPSGTNCRESCQSQSEMTLQGGGPLRRTVQNVIYGCSRLQDAKPVVSYWLSKGSGDTGTSDLVNNSALRSSSRVAPILGPPHRSL
jgi:hypothetical protein